MTVHWVPWVKASCVGQYMYIPVARGQLTDVVNSSSAELPIELLGPQLPKILNGARPQMQNIIPRKRTPLFNNDYFCSE